MYSQMVKIMSYNIWFDNTNRLERLESLIASITVHDPDIICLQEVIPDVYKALKKILKEYKFTFPNKLETSYGCVIMSKHMIIESMEYEYTNTKMDRSLLVTKILVPCIESDGGMLMKEIIVGNTHFESLFRTKIKNTVKLEQYREAESVLDAFYDDNRNVIFCADTNLLATEESEFFSSSWKDAWQLKGNKDEQYTYDSFKNTNLCGRQIGKYKSRLDRILFKGSNIELLDYSMIQGINDMIELSDHFGITGTFNLL